MLTLLSCASGCGLWLRAVAVGSGWDGAGAGGVVGNGGWFRWMVLVGRWGGGAGSLRRNREFPVRRRAGGWDGELEVLGDAASLSLWELSKQCCLHFGCCDHQTKGWECHNFELCLEYLGAVRERED